MKKINNESANLFEFLIKNEIKIPTYQRIYTWKEEQIARFLDDLIFDISKGRDINFGVMYTDEKKSNNSYEIIDGQQRLTTFYLLTNALVFLGGDLKTADAKKLLKFNESKNLSTSIKSLNKSYDDFYSFINSKVLHKEPTNIRTLLNRYVKENNISDEDNKEAKTVKSELVIAFQYILEFLSKESNEESKNLLMNSKDDRLDILESTFFNIPNPYPTDPISLFERLNNRGVELNFVSLSKIKIHQYIMNTKTSKQSTQKIEEVANHFLVAYNSLIYSSFGNYHNSMNADKKDQLVQSALIGYLEIYGSTKLAKDKNKALEELGKYLNDRLGSIKDFTKFIKSDAKKMIYKAFEHFQYYLTVYLIFEAGTNKTVKGNFNKEIATHVQTISKYPLVEEMVPRYFYSIADYSKLKAIKIEKYNNLIIFATSLAINEYQNNPDNKSKTLTSESMEKFSNELVKLSIYYWLRFIGKSEDYSLLLRDELELDEFYKITSKSVKSTYAIDTLTDLHKLNAELISNYEKDPKFVELFKNFKNEASQILTDNQLGDNSSRWKAGIQNKVKHIIDFVDEYKIK